MFLHENLLFNLFLINIFLPIAFVYNKFSNLNFPFILSILFGFYIYIYLNYEVNYQWNFIWWLFLIIISLDISYSLSFWEWWFIFVFVLISLNVLLSGFLFNFLGLFLILEVQAIVFLILIQSETFTSIGVESAAKWSLLNAVSSLLLITGFIVLYYLSGTINFLDFFLLDLSVDLNYRIAISLLFSSLIFKIALPPFHFWLPDVYETSNIVLVSLLVGPIKLFYVILLNYLIILQKDVGNFFFIFGGFCILFGLIMTLNQTILKRFLAWTGIFYFGVFLLFLSEVNIENQFFLKVYITIYILSSLIIIMYSKFNLLRLSDLIYLFGDNFLFGLSFLILLIVIIGLPVISGFFGKLIFYYSLLSTTGSLFFVLFLVILTSYAFYYYLSLLIYGLSYKINSNNNIILSSNNIKFNLMVYIMFILNIIIFLFPSQFAELFLYFI